MLLNVLIADDEYFIRQRIKKIIPWDEMSLHFAGEAANGLEVLNFLKTAPVDIIFLDIKMPKMDGLKVCEHIYHHYPSVKIIILSGYNDFEYARTTLHFHAMDYLLKPIEQEVLSEALKRCRSQIILEKKEQQKLSKYLYYEKCSMLSAVMSGSLAWQEYYNFYPEAEPAKYFMYTAIYLSPDSEDTIICLVRNLRQNNMICEYFKETDYMYVLQTFLRGMEEEETFKNLISEFIMQCATYIFLFTGLPCSIAENWSISFRSVLRMLGCRYFHETTAILYEKDNTFSSKPIADLSQIRDRLLYYLNGKDEAGFETYLNFLFDEIRCNRNPILLPLIVTECFVTLGIHFDNAEGSSMNVHEYVSQLLDEEYHLDNIKSTVMSTALQCISQKSLAPSDVSLSNKIIAYIHENYADQELSVAKVADLFNLNASYISSLFKKVNNISLLQYITKIRLEHSKQLLMKNRYKITDIAEMIGYSDVFYYSKRFKKAYGCSPKEYLHSVQEKFRNHIPDSKLPPN